jgi:hypothetical protein
VINNLYIIGNTTYGGLMNIVSKNGDMAGIDLPEPSFFFKYRGLQPDREDTLLPEFRNTHYWEPCLPVEPGQDISITLPSPVQTGSYTVLVRGVTEHGNRLLGKCSFLVKTQ